MNRLLGVEYVVGVFGSDSIAPCGVQGSRHARSGGRVLRTESIRLLPSLVTVRCLDQQRYSQSLESPHFRYLYEDIQQRRAGAFVNLDRYVEALPLLEEAVSFTVHVAG
jgi:hypothetical protein